MQPSSISALYLASELCPDPHLSLLSLTHTLTKLLPSHDYIYEKKKKEKQRHAHTGFIAQGRALKAQSLSANISAQTPSSTSAKGVGGDSSTQKQNTRI